MRLYERRVDEHGERVLAVYARGAALLDDALLNKGTCFTAPEREALGLRGLLPPRVSTPETQRARAYANYRRAGDDVQRYVFLNALQERNETLFYRLLLEHLEEMLPVVYTPTVGKACQRYSHIFRRPRGVYLSANERGRFAEILQRAPVQDCQVIVVTDSEAILGLGDLGVGGMGIPVGKLALYTAAAGIHPGSCLAITLDVGTNNRALLEDPLYLGVPQPRLRGEPYLELVDEFVEAVQEVFPGVLLQWEDFANDNAFALLGRYRDRMLTFNDDIQGTAAVVMAAIHAALRRAGRRLRDERAVVLGVGAAGGGIARVLREAMLADGADERELSSRVLCVDSRGLVLSDRAKLAPHKRAVAADPAIVARWDAGAVPDLAAVVRHARPTILLGTSGQGGAFTEEIVRGMAEHCERPIVFPLSNPTDNAEGTPERLLRWTGGRALVATGTGFPPLELDGTTHRVAQANNAFVFPGIGLGALAARARNLPDSAFLAASEALAATTTEVGDAPGAPLLPPLADLRAVSRRVARAVARRLMDDGDAEHAGDAELEQRLDALQWQPEYVRYVPA